MALGGNPALQPHLDARSPWSTVQTLGQPCAPARGEARPEAHHPSSDGAVGGGKTMHPSLSTRGLREGSLSSSLPKTRPPQPQLWPHFTLRITSYPCPGLAPVGLCA